MNLRALLYDFSDDELTRKLFRELTTLGGIMFGLALSLSFGDISHTTQEFASHPTFWRLSQIVFRPSLVVTSWLYFMRTVLYNKRRRTAFFWLIVLALISAAIAEFGFAGLPLLPGAGFFEAEPQDVHLLELACYALSSFFLFIACANGTNWRTPYAATAIQVRSACINSAIFAIALSSIGLALSFGNIQLWHVGQVLVLLTFVVSVSLRTKWRSQQLASP